MKRTTSVARKKPTRAQRELLKTLAAAHRRLDARKKANQ